MSERARLLGGTLTIAASPATGTEVVASVPYWTGS
jgi:signal transduction histidine kinase